MQYAFDHLAFYANYRSPDMHSHFAKHLIFAPKGILNCNVEGESFMCRGVIIQSGAKHTVNITEQPMLVYLIDETCRRAKTLDENNLQGKSYAVINDDVCAKVLGTEDDTERLKYCGLDCDGTAEYDERIKTVLDIIDNSETIESGIMNKLCSAVFLSESRLSHLFHEQVGISVAGYILFSKLSKTYDYMCNGESITTAAIHAGFSGSAHFAAVNVTIIGASLGGMLAPRAAAFEKRISRVIAWSVFLNFQEVLLNAVDAKKRSIFKTLIKLKLGGIVNIAMKKVAKSDELIRWGLEHGMYAYEAKTPYEYAMKMNNYQMMNVAEKITQDIFIAGASRDHFIDYTTVGKEIAALKNARSVTFRLFTEQESACNHCNCGNVKLTFDTFIYWILQMKSDNR